LESKDFDPVEASLQRLENKAKKLYGVLLGLKLLEYCTFSLMNVKNNICKSNILFCSCKAKYMKRKRNNCGLICKGEL